VTTESGQTTTEFFVVPGGRPDRHRIEPAAGEPNTTGPRHAARPHLTGGTVSEASPDLSLANQVVVDDETITLHVDVAPARRRTRTTRSP
jgi:hypothetical protein